MIQSENLKGSGAITHGFFTREGGVSQGIYASKNCGYGAIDDERRAIDENRRRVAASLGVDRANLITVYQIHSARAVCVNAPFAPDKAPRADALVTNTPGLAIGILTADCAPVLFAEPKAMVIGAAHAGWQGALGGVLEQTLSEMEKLGARRERIRAAIGPAISAAAYQVGPEFWDRFMDDDETNECFFRGDDVSGKYLFDLPGYITARLEKAGIESAENSCLCTYSEETRFFSYRRATHRGEPDYGRQISAISIAR